MNAGKPTLWVVDDKDEAIASNEMVGLRFGKDIDQELTGYPEIDELDDFLKADLYVLDINNEAGFGMGSSKNDIPNLVEAGYLTQNEADDLADYPGGNQGGIILAALIKKHKPNASVAFYSGADLGTQTSASLIMGENNPNYIGFFDKTSSLKEIYTKLIESKKQSNIGTTDQRAPEEPVAGQPLELEVQ